MRLTGRMYGCSSGVGANLLSGPADGEPERDVPVDRIMVMLSLVGG
jgi:hypothetical protein